MYDNYLNLVKKCFGIFFSRNFSNFSLSWLHCKSEVSLLEFYCKTFGSRRFSESMEWVEMEWVHSGKLPFNR